MRECSVAGESSRAGWEQQLYSRLTVLHSFAVPPRLLILASPSRVALSSSPSNDAFGTPGICGTLERSELDGSCGIDEKGSKSGEPTFTYFQETVVNENFALDTSAGGCTVTT